jgi:hypothetical protein
VHGVTCIDDIVGSARRDVQPAGMDFMCNYKRNKQEGSNRLTLSTSKNSAQATVTVRAGKEASRSMRHSSTIFGIPYPCAQCSDSRSDPRNTKTPDATLFSTRDISTNMTEINNAIAAIRALPSGDKLSYRQAAIQFKVDRSTLRRRHKEGQTSVEAKNVRQCKLHPH